MGLYDVVLRDDLPNSFVDDSYVLDTEMEKLYARSNFSANQGQILDHNSRFAKNASIINVQGLKIWWGDFKPEDVQELLGIHYVLSEQKSFWDAPEDSVVARDLHKASDIYSRSKFKDWLPREIRAFDMDYVRKNAFARINDGKNETSKNLILLHH